MIKKQFLGLWFISFCSILLWSSLSFASMGSSHLPKIQKLSSGHNTFIFDPKTRVWKAVSANGTVIRSGRGSGGRGYCPDIHRSCRTPSGHYSLISKRGADCRSSRYPVGRGGSPMPYCMFFTKYYAVHGSYDVPNHNASHGCIRVRPGDAKWLYHHFMRIGTRVIVKSY